MASRGLPRGVAPRARLRQSRPARAEGPTPRSLTPLLGGCSLPQSTCIYKLVCPQEGFPVRKSATLYDKIAGGLAAARGCELMAVLHLPTPPKRDPRGSAR